MKVKELIKQLEKEDPEAEIQVLAANPLRYYSGKLYPIEAVSRVFNQDTNKGKCTIEIHLSE